MKRGVQLFTICFVVLLAAAAQASFKYEGNTIKQTYNSGDEITGYIKLSLTNASFDSLITSNINGSITLGELLQKSGLKHSIDYTCSNTNCTRDYAIGDQISTLQLNGTTPATIGFRIYGDNIKINDLSINIATDAPPSCRKQIATDIFDEQKYYLQNMRYTETPCSGKMTGCFDRTLPDSSYFNVQLSDTPYCIKQTLPSAPAYKLGATIRRGVATPNENLTMFIYPSDFSTTPFGECSLPVSEATESVNDVSCVVEYGSSVEREYYICISSNKPNSEWTIRAEQTSPTCGAYAINPADVQKDFELSVQPLTYDTPNFKIDSGLFNNIYYTDNFSRAANEFIQKKYDNNCIQNECIIPITLTGSNQTVTISNPILSYTSDNIPTTETRVYKVEEESAFVSADNVSLNLASAGFLIPYGTQPSYITFYLDDHVITKVAVNVTKGVLFDISPRFALIGVPTQFSVSSSENLTSAVWNFGEIGATAQGLNTTYTFTQAGTYSVSANIATGSGKTSSRTVQVLVGEPKASAEELLNINKNRITGIASYLSSSPSWTQDMIKTKVNPQALNASLSKIEAKLNAATQDSEFIEVINEMQALDIPSSVGVSKQGTYPLILLYSHIDTSIIEGLSNMQSTSEDQLRTALMNWVSNNYDAQIKISNIDGKYDEGMENIMSTIEVDLTPKAEIQDTQYLIINYPFDAIKFEQEYGQKQVGSATYIPLSTSITQVNFAIPESAGIDTLDVYLAPKLDALERSGEVIKFAENPKKTQTTFIVIGLIVLIIVVLGAAFGLQYWYKKNYEARLFKKSDDLYNVMTFIYNSRNSGLDSSEIKKKLEQAGWRGEQIKYAFDKLGGRVLGIFGIPIFKAAQEKKVVGEIQRREQINTGTTFIKRPPF